MTYQLAREGAQRVFQVSKAFPPEERYSLTDQVRRSSRAVKAILAEAWARRGYKAVFLNKLSEALGEATETQSWLDDALDCGYIAQATFDELDTLYQRIGGKLNTMAQHADEFCSNPNLPRRVRESPVAYDQQLDEL